MRHWSRRHTLAGGIALILLTNAVALLGVAHNRSGEPDSILTLTQRELQQPYGWALNRENSGMSLRLRWRFPAKEEYSGYYSGGSPDWLDESKVASLGFDVNPPAGVQDRYQWAARQLSREVLVVLEMDGTGYQQALQHARTRSAEQDAKLALAPGDKHAQDGAKFAREALAREESTNSRLFAVDAGLSAAELRARFPDRTRYAIVRAEVHLATRGEKNKFAGYIDKLSVGEINVPHHDRKLLEQESRVSRLPPGVFAPLFAETGSQAPFTARIAFGQRLEPWLLGLSSGANAQ